MTTLGIPVLAFQEIDFCEIHGAQCSSTRLVHNEGSRNNCICIQLGGEQMYGRLREHLPAKILSLFKMRDYTEQDTVYSLAGTQLMNRFNLGHMADICGLVTIFL